MASALTDPASASPGRLIARLACCASAGVQTVCRQSRRKPWRNAVGKVAALPAIAQQNSLNKPLWANTHLTNKTPEGEDSARCFGSVDINRQISSRYLMLAIPALRTNSMSTQLNFSALYFLHN